MRPSWANLDRRVAAIAALFALVVGTLVVIVEVVVAHEAKSNARARVDAAAGRAATLATELRDLAGQRAAGVTQYPAVQNAFATQNADVLGKFAAHHPNIEFRFRNGAVVGSVQRGAVVQRVEVVTASGPSGQVIAGVVPKDAQFASLQARSPHVQVSYYVDGIRRWPPRPRHQSGGVVAQVPFPSEGMSSVRLATRVSTIPARWLWPPLAALLTALVAAPLLSTRRRIVPGRDVAKSLDIVGETLAATHDPQALLPVVLKAATEATGAAGGVILTDDIPRVSRGVTNGRRAEHLDVPLRTESATVSILRLYSGAEPFDQDAHDAAKWIATQAEIALENAHLHRLVQQQALTDDLTSLPNRRRFMAEYRREAQRADRSGTPLSVIVLDIDDFKRVNDTWGHETGDSVLRALARALANATRSVDLAARLGGEEFAVLLPNTDAHDAESVAQRIQHDLSTTEVRWGSVAVQATASFGISSFPDLASLPDLLNDADRALYEAKRAGKNRIVVAAPTES